MILNSFLSAVESSRFRSALHFRVEIEEFYSLLSQYRQPFSARFPPIVSVPQDSYPNSRSGITGGTPMGTGAVGKGEICKPKRIRVILRAFSKSTLPPSLPPARVARSSGSATVRAKYTLYLEKTHDSR